MVTDRDDLSREIVDPTVWVRGERLISCVLDMSVLCRCFARLKREASQLHIIFYGGIVVCAHQKFVATM